jgi:hypothetical protein
MGNPIQDWLDKLTKPKSTVTGTTTIGKSTKPKAAGKASTGTESTGSTGNIFETSLQKQKEAIAKKTNQDIINAAYKVADELKLEGGPWPLMRAAGWGHLTDKRGDLYKGPAVDEIDKLTAEQKAALKRVLGL